MLVIGINISIETIKYFFRRQEKHNIKIEKFVLATKEEMKEQRLQKSEGNIRHLARSGDYTLRKVNHDLSELDRRISKIERMLNIQKPYVNKSINNLW